MFNDGAFEFDTNDRMSMIHVAFRWILLNQQFFFLLFFQRKCILHWFNLAKRYKSSAENSSNHTTDSLFFKANLAKKWATALQSLGCVGFPILKILPAMLLSKSTTSYVSDSTITEVPNALKSNLYFPFYCSFSHGYVAIEKGEKMKNLEQEELGYLNLFQSGLKICFLTVFPCSNSWELFLSPVQHFQHN